MISLQSSIETIQNYHIEHYTKCAELEALIRELYWRKECTPLDSILNHPQTRALFKRLIDKAVDLEIEICGDCPVTQEFVNDYGFNCDCSQCQIGPVVIEHMEITDYQTET